MSAHRESLRRIGTERIMIMGVPRKWFVMNGTLTLALLFLQANLAEGLITGSIIFLLIHIPCRMAAARDPYFFYLLRRSLAERKIYEA